MSPKRRPLCKRSGQLGLALLLLALAVPVSPALAGPDAAAQAQAVAQAEAAVTILERGAGSLTLELRVPSLTVEESSVGGAACQMLTAPGLTPLARAGMPLVPVRGEILGLPLEEEAELRLEVLEATGEPLAAHRLCPAEMLEGTSPLSGPGEQVVPEEADVPERYPGPLAEVGFRGRLRGQPVAQVLFFPVQVEDGGERLWFYPRLRVRLSYDATLGMARAARLSGGAFESLLEDVLLNEPLPVSAEAEAPVPAEAESPSAFEALKVYVEEDGMVQITPEDLASAGWDVTTLDPRTLKVSNQGTEIRVWVKGQEDGSFDGDPSGDYLLFYGQAMTGRYTRRNVYWLTAGGADGQRMETREGNPVNGWDVAGSFPETRHAEVDIGVNGYWQNPPGREAQDHWYWTAKLHAPASADLAFTMPPFDASGGDVTLRVQLAGYTDDYGANPDHHTRIKVNGTEVHDATWNGMIEYQHVTAFSPGLLLEGGNTLRVETVGDTGAAVDTVYANWLELDYQGRYESQSEELVFGVPGAGHHRFEIGGFGGDGVEAFDITDPKAPVRLLNVQSQAAQSNAPSSGQTAVFEDQAGVSARYVALRPAAYRDAAGMEADVPSDLRNPGNGADVIIISHDGFYEDVQLLAAHRQAQGLRVQTVRLTDVQDEFSGGVFTPEAIRDFLAYAYQSWQTPAPAYVLLVGDANLDYQDRFGTGMPNYVPTYVIDASSVGETGNDNWFACVDGEDYLPDLFVGRFSAQSRADVQTMVGKVIAYETNLPSGGWEKRAVYVADDDSASFEEAAENWIGQLPAGYQEQRIYVSEYPPGDPSSDIVTAINAGAFVVSYVGHGNQDRWGNWSGGSFFTMSTVGQLTNASRLPFMATATCLNGFFVNPYVPYSIAEELARKADGGAIGVWSPSALGYPSEHDVLFGKMFDELFGSRSPTMGSLTTWAKVNSAGKGVSQELIETFTLFGDPALGFTERLAPPVLDPIANEDGDGDYAVSWSSITGALTYRLEMDDDEGFGSPSVAYEGGNISHAVTGQPGGTWHYRVQARKPEADSPWSGTETVRVEGGYRLYVPVVVREGTGR